MAFIQDEARLGELVSSLKATHHALPDEDKITLRPFRDALMDIRGVGEGAALEIIAAVGRLLDESAG
jgi:transposase